MKKLLGVICIIGMMSGCAWWASAAPVIRGIVDIAELLCQNAMSDEPEPALKGQSVEAFCQQEKNLQPFLDEVLRARYAAKQGLPQ